MALLPTFDYQSYQDVRKNLFWYWLGVLVVGFLGLSFVLPDAHRRAVESLVKRMAAGTPLESVAGVTVGGVVLVAVAFLLAEVLKFHDLWYDKYVTRWRQRFSGSSIFPRLVEPFISRTPPGRLITEAERNAAKFLERLYYPFVGDIDGKVPKNKVLRFYEAVTVYWITQINEIVMVFLAIVVGLYAFGYHARVDHGYAIRLLQTLVTLITLLFLNRVFVRFAVGSVAKTVDEEIAAIHEDPRLLADLQKRLKSVCSDYSIPYQ
jgi:hypothetical protein